MSFLLLLLTYPKKINAFWKKIAIPGYTTGFSAKDTDLQVTALII